MAITLWGLTIGDDGTGFVVPTLAEIREAGATQIRQWRGIANLQTQPGSLFGDIIDLVAMGVDIALQGAQQAVLRTLFSAAQGVGLDQILAGYVTRVQASASTVVAYVYGTAGSAFGAGLALRTSLNGTAFNTDGAVAIPAAPAEAYAVEIAAFAAGAYAAQAFTITVDGTPVAIVANNLDDGFSVRNALVTAINALALTQTAYRGGLSPTTGRYTILIIEEGGGGSFPLAVAGPASTIFSWNAIATPATANVTGPTPAPPESLRYFPATAGIVGVVNPEDAIDGRTQETDSQLRARWQILQRGMGGGNPDAVRAIILSPTAVGGGGASFCTVEYNPTDVTDASGNLPHSLRVIVDSDAVAANVGLATWKAKAAGDNTNGPEAVIITDAGVPPQNQTVYIDRLADVWIGVEITVSTGVDWPNTGEPLAQLRSDVVSYIEALQPSPTGGVRVNLLPISLYPDGTPRGVINLTVRVGDGAAPGGPFTWRDYYPTVEPDADAASVLLTGRDKARCVISDVAAVIV